MLLLLLTGSWTRQAGAYSLLTHEQLIDLTWEDSILPLLMSHYPNLTPAELDQARAYAYGGCVIQDIGYYPFGDGFFSNLTHYVRTGDFVVALIRNAHNANELAFAVGALSHYIGDSYGHSQATNRAVPIEFPKLERRFGPIVNYAEGRHEHVRVEFAFDIDQIAHHRMAPLGYMRHIGIQVPVHQLALAFYETYGLTEDFNVSRGRKFNLKAYRFATRTFIPRVAYAVTLLHRKQEPVEPDTPDAIEIEKESSGAAKLYNWAAYHKRAPVETHLLAGVLWVLPKIGPLSMVAVKGPTAAAEADYMHSVVSATTVLHERLAIFTPIEARRERMLTSTTSTETLGPVDPKHPLPNRDLDTGQVVKPGGYPLTDTTYARLLDLLTRTPTQAIPPGIKSDVEAYYADPNAPIVTKQHPGEWKKVQEELKTLEAMPTSTEAAPYPTYGELKRAKK
ncbi:MAG: zinc dependent phospholipase C family protein [Bryobacteraceae bacterium]